MKITIELDPGEAARGVAPAVTAASAQETAPMAPPSVVEAVHSGAIDAGPAPGTSTGATVSGAPAEVAAQAAAIGAISAGPAPDLD